MVGEGGSHHGEDLPKHKHGPQQNSQVLGLASRDEIPGRSAHPEGAADSTDRKSQPHDHARHQLHFPARTAERVDEYSPAQSRDSGQLTASLQREVEFTHGVALMEMLLEPLSQIPFYTIKFTSPAGLLGLTSRAAVAMIEVRGGAVW